MKTVAEWKALFLLRGIEFEIADRVGQLWIHQPWVAASPFLYGEPNSRATSGQVYRTLEEAFEAAAWRLRLV